MNQKERDPGPGIATGLSADRIGSGGPSAWRWFLVLWLVGTAVRLVYLLQIRNAPDIVNPILDSNWYFTQALRMVGGQWLGDVPFWRAPAYQFFLAPLFYLGRGDPFLARLVQVVLSGATAGLVYLIARRLFGHRIGLAAGCLACGYQMLIYFSTELLAVTLEVFANMLMLVAVLRADERGTRGGWFVAGLALGFSAVVRPNVLLFALMLVLFVKGMRSWRRNWAPAVALAAGTLVLILPVTAVNTIKGGDPVLVAYQGGVNFYIGNSPYADGKTVFVPGGHEQEYHRSLGEYRCQVRMVSEHLAEEDLGCDLRPSQIDRYWYRKTIGYILDEPGHFARLVGRKLYYFWNTYEVTNNRNIELFLAENARWLRAPVPWFGLVAPLGLVGMALSWRRGRPVHLLVLFVAAQVASVLLFFVCARFRMSSAAVLVVFAPYTVWWLVERIRRLDWRRAGAALAVLVPLFWISHTDYFRVREVTDQAVHHFHQALALRREGRLQEAVDMMRLAIRFCPTDPMPHMALGSTLLEMDRVTEARESYERALALRPSMGAIVHSDLATFLASEGRVDEAVAEFRAALAVDPAFIHGRLNLARLLTNVGRADEALPHFTEVLEQAPEQAGKVLPEMAIALDHIGRRDEAIGAVRTALEKDKTNGRAHALLARYLEEAGRRDEARQEWKLAREWAADGAARAEADEHLEALR